MSDTDVSGKDAFDKPVEEIASKISAEADPVKEVVKRAFAEATAAFGSPHPEPAPEAPACMPTPEVNPAKQLDFNLNPVTPSTPVLVSQGTEELDYNAFIASTLLWTNKIRSSFYFVAGCLAWLVVRGIFTSPTTLTTGVCYTLLASLAFNFFRGVLAPKYQERCTWSNSAITRFVSSALSTTVSAAAALHDRHLNGLDPLHTLEVGLGLWILSVLGRALDVVTILLLLHLGAFSVPLLYKTNKTRIDTVAADVYGKVKVKYEKLDRRIRATMVLVPMGLVLVLLPNIDRFVAIFIGLAYGRALAKPDEYATFQKRIEPVSKAVQKAVVTPLTNATTSAITKYDITPTPSKRKAA